MKGIPREEHLRPEIDPVTKRFVKGNVGGPGRPKGTVSIKDMIRKRLEEHPEEVNEIVQHFIKNNRELMWQMLEGRPQQDVTSGGEKLPQPLLHGLYNNNSDEEDKPAEQEN